jgi:hypothetical protein
MARPLGIEYRGVSYQASLEPKMNEYFGFDINSQNLHPQGKIIWGHPLKGTCQEKKNWVFKKLSSFTG